mmetsp:Transcript_70895/g.125265  ORF Transcript_70895/g.125265 Transcript_70895/m.125265 type:complete len:291 (+) Transcript_70895:111-983(+)
MTAASRTGRFRRRQAFVASLAAAAAGLLLFLTPGWTAAGVGEPTSSPQEVPQRQAKALAAAWQEVDRLSELVDQQGVVAHFGNMAAGVLKKSLLASGARDGEAEALEQAVDAPLEALFRQQLLTLVARAADRYEEIMAARPNPVEARKAAEDQFLEGAKKLVRPGADWSYEAELLDLRSTIGESYSQDTMLIDQQGKQGKGKHVTIEVIRKLQQQSAAVQREVETRGAFPWNVKWQYLLDNSPLGFRGQYSQGRSIVELLLMPSPDPRLKKNLLNRIGPLNLAVAFDMLL